MTTKARQQLFNLLGQTADTPYALVQFVQSKICEKVNTPLAEISDKALAKHLNALINGPTQLTNHTSPRARKAIQGTPFRGELLVWGVGDASRRNEWPEAVAAAKRLADAKQWPLGQTLAYLADLLQIEPSNRLLTGTVAWLLDGEILAEFGEYAEQRGHQFKDELLSKRSLLFSQEEAQS